MGFSNVQPIELENAGVAVHEVSIAEHGVPAYGLTISTNDDFIGKQPKALAGFLRATKRAVQEVSASREAGVQALARAVPEIDTKREVKALERTVPLWAGKGTDVSGFGAQSEQGWQQTIDVAKRVGLIEKGPAAASVFNASFLK